MKKQLKTAKVDYKQKFEEEKREVQRVQDGFNYEKERLEDRIRELKSEVVSKENEIENQRQMINIIKQESSWLRSLIQQLVLDPEKLKVVIENRQDVNSTDTQLKHFSNIKRNF